MNILLAVEQADLRLALELMLNTEPGVKVVGEASESEGLLALIAATQPDLAILGSDLPGRGLTMLLAEIKSQDDAPLLIVMDRDPAKRQQVLDAGADAFVVMGDPPEKLITTFRELSSQLSPKP